MTRDEIIRMAREAGFVDESFCRWGAYTDDLERFVDLIEKHLIASGYRKCAVGQRTTQFCGQLEQAVLVEREACAKVCDEQVVSKCLAPLEIYRTEFIAAAIRARGEK